MQAQRNATRSRVSGHIYVQERAKGPVWYWKLRLPTGGEERRAIGPAWTGTGRTPDGYFTKRTAQAALEARLTDLRRGIGIPARTGATFRDAAESWYTHGTNEKGWKPSTRRDYRSALDVHLLPAFGGLRLEDVTAKAIERWRSAGLGDGTIKRRTAVKLLAMLHVIMERARKQYGLMTNPVADVEKLSIRYVPEDYDFYSVEEVWSLVRAAQDDQDGIIILTAACTGLRMGELLALRVRDVDFENDAIRVLGSYDHRAGEVGTTKGGRGRVVPMVPDVSRALAAHLQREHFTTPTDLVFVNVTGGHIDGSALRRRYRIAQTAAKLRPLRFHDLRHTFGSLAINSGSTADVQHWLGHADARTTGRYVHYKKRSDEAQRLGLAFQRDTVESPEEVQA